MQGFDQLLERQVLVRLGPQRRRPHLLQQLRERQLRAELGVEHLSVGEKADQAFGFHAAAVGHRHADTNIGLPGVTVQQGLERGQQEHEQGDVVLTRHSLQCGMGRGGQDQVQARTTVALHGWTRTVGR
ncbi:hypothetical protein D3C77_229830 [compost metagenome]